MGGQPQETTAQGGGVPGQDKRAAAGDLLAAGLIPLMPLVTSGIFLAGLTAILHVVGVLYADAFVYDLSLPITSVGFSKSYYLTAALLPVAATAILFAPALLAGRWRRRGAAVAFLANLPVLYVAGAFVIFFHERALGTSYRLPWLATGLGFVALDVYLSVHAWPLARTLYAGNLLERAALVLCFTVAAMGAAHYFGTLDAQALATGSSGVGTGAILHFRDPTNPLDGVPLILVVDDGVDSDLIAPQGQPAPGATTPTSAYPRLYVVPDADVAITELQRGPGLSTSHLTWPRTSAAPTPPNGPPPG